MESVFGLPATSYWYNKYIWDLVPPVDPGPAVDQGLAVDLGQGPYLNELKAMDHIHIWNDRMSSGFRLKAPTREENM